MTIHGAGFSARLGGLTMRNQRQRGKVFFANVPSLSRALPSFSVLTISLHGDFECLGSSMIQ